MKIIMSFLFCCLSIVAIAQPAPDFTVTDSDGVVHQLYADHLDQGQTVVLKLFFTTCPPCISLAPWMEENYQQWGAGEYDVEFIELSTQSFDSNADVASFKSAYGLTFPSVGADGGSKEAAVTYQNGSYGPYYGTPTLVVIAPDGTVTMGFAYDEFDDVLAATGATGMAGGSGGADEVTTYDLSSSIPGSSTPSDIKYFLKSADSDFPKYDILAITGGSLSIDYPSVDFPELSNPVIVAEAEGDLLDGNINAVDLLKIRKHILDIDPFADEYQMIAADVNSDNKINAVDLLGLQKAILGITTSFSNDTPVWKVIPSQIELTENLGQTVNVDFQFIKTGNVN